MKIEGVLIGVATFISQTLSCFKAVIFGTVGGETTCLTPSEVLTVRDIVASVPRDFPTQNGNNEARIRYLPSNVASFIIVENGSGKALVGYERLLIALIAVLFSASTVIVARLIVLFFSD